MKILGLITRVNTGEISQGKNVGDTWQQLTIEGLRFFVPSELQNGYCRGQRVRCELLYRGDKKRTDGNGAISYESDYELMTIEVIPEVSL